jgi:hypothetical protein
MSVMASKVRSHSFFSREISSKRIAFSSAMAMCLATGSSSARSRSEYREGTVGERDADRRADPLAQQLAVQREGGLLQVAADPGLVVAHDPARARPLHRGLHALFHLRAHLGVEGEDQQVVLLLAVEQQAGAAVVDEPPQLGDDHAEDRADAQAGADDAAELVDDLQVRDAVGGAGARVRVCGRGAPRP